MTWLTPKRFKPIVTKYERKLCHALQKEGIHFIPQAKIKTKSGRTYRVDILIQPSLVLEVGYINPTDIQEHEDLKQTGYTVLHFPNKEVKNHIHQIIQTIKKARSTIKSSKT